jgi:hypothetical protein
MLVVEGDAGECRELAERPRAQSLPAEADSTTISGAGSARARS